MLTQLSPRSWSAHFCHETFSAPQGLGSCRTAQCAHVPVPHPREGGEGVLRREEENQRAATGTSTCVPQPRGLTARLPPTGAAVGRVGSRGHPNFLTRKHLFTDRVSVPGEAILPPKPDRRILTPTI